MIQYVKKSAYKFKIQNQRADSEQCSPNDSNLNVSGMRSGLLVGFGFRPFLIRLRSRYIRHYRRREQRVRAHQRQARIFFFFYTSNSLESLLETTESLESLEKLMPDRSAEAQINNIMYYHTKNITDTGWLLLMLSTA
jgi:hypothetical protein